MLYEVLHPVLLFEGVLFTNDETIKLSSSARYATAASCSSVSVSQQITLSGDGKRIASCFHELHDQPMAHYHPVSDRRTAITSFDVYACYGRREVGHYSTHTYMIQCRRYMFAIPNVCVSPSSS